MSKHIKSLDSVGKLRDGEYYKYDTKKGFTLVNPSEIIYKTHSIDSLYSYYETYISLKKHLDELNALLLEVLDKRIQGVSYSELEHTIRESVKVIDKLTLNVEGLNVYVLDDEDYVQTHLDVKGIITLENSETPLDINSGCYKAILDNGKVKFILDKEKYERLWI